ncbi:MAG: twin-arginine translocation signal domain-containing protein [Desulfosudis oleivorans]|nr:twin-arginine translocation signal domain-containing protein [Desulfosudis oleivorans]
MKRRDFLRFAAAAGIAVPLRLEDSRRDHRKRRRR